jgi:DNA-binding response OmpR family regulator
VKAILSRYRRRVPPPQKICVGEVEFDFVSFEARRAGKKLEVTCKCMELMQYLFAHRNQVVKRSNLLDAVWGMETDLNTRTIDNHMVKLRQLIETDPKHPHFLITIHGIGYKLSHCCPD